MENGMYENPRQLPEAEVWNLISRAKERGTIHEKDLNALLEGAEPREEIRQTISRKLEEYQISLIPESQGGSIFYPRLEELKEAYAWDALTMLYLEELEKTGLARCLTPEEECRLAVQADPESENRLLEGTLLRVISMARQYLGKGIPPLDLFSEGNLGLKAAAETFRQAGGCSFALHSVYHIRKAMTAALETCIVDRRIPEGIADLARQLKSVKSSAEPLPVRDDCPPQPEKEVEQKLLKELMQPVLEELTPREAEVLRYRFGLTDGRTHTLEETGLQFGVTRERIRQIEHKAMRRAGRSGHKKQIRDFYT